MIKNYGLVIDKITPDQYVLGGLTSLPKIVLKEDGQWDDYLPTYEPQFNQKFDSYGCTVWGTENAIEVLMKQKTGLEANYSERFIYILAKIRPPGTSPHLVAEYIRQEGLINNDLLPMTESYEEFLRPDPMDVALLVEGQKWPYYFQHEWLWDNMPDKQTRVATIKEMLRYSPIGVSVSAWYKENGVYVDRDQPNNHWCVIFGYNDKGFKVFDSYDQSVKTLSFDHQIEAAKRYLLTPRVVTQNAILDVLKRVLNSLADMVRILISKRHA